MTDFTITHRIEAPELAAAINNLAEALKARPAVVPTAGQSTTPAQETPAQAPVAAPTPVPPTTPTVTPAAATTTVPDTTAAAGPVNATPVQTPNVAPSNPAPAAPTKVYTFDDITNAGSQLLELGKMNQLMELLKGYGVQAVTQLKPEQYADVAAGLRGLGAKI